MNLKKLATLLSMAVAAIALAAPASASAEAVFTHEEEPIEHNDSKTVVFSGVGAFAIPGTNAGIHCSHITTSITLEATGTGTVTSYITQQNGNTACTSTPDNFVVHTTATGLPWTIQTDGHDTLTMTGVRIYQTVTHPATPHLVVSQRELTGNFHATTSAGQTTDSKTLTISGEGTIHLFPGTASIGISGQLERTTDTQVGSATVETR